MPALCTPGRELESGSIARRLLIAVLAQAVVAGCARPRAMEDDGVRVDMSVTPQPPEEGTAHVEIVIRDEEGRPLDVSGVKLEGNMTHAGMKPSFAIARRKEQGRWLADLELTMPGDWLVSVQARLGDGREIERTIELPGVVSR